MSINQGTGSYQAFCTEIDKIFPHPTCGSYALPTQRSDIDEDDSTFPSVRNMKLLEKQHAIIVKAVQRTPDQEEAMNSILGIDFSKFSPAQLKEIFSQKTL